MKQLFNRSRRFSTLALLVLLTIVVSLSFISRASAASSPFLKHHKVPAIRLTSAATPSHNALLNVTADQSDVDEPTGGSAASALCYLYYQPLSEPGS